MAVLVGGFPPDPVYGQSYDMLFPPQSVVSRTVYCTNLLGARVPNCKLNVFTGFYTNTNGHFHNTNRPASLVGASSSGPFSISTMVTTGPAGSATVWVSTTRVGQAEFLLVCSIDVLCDLGNHAVGVPGIFWVEEKPEWVHIGGGTTGHGGNEFNHWMTSSAALGIWLTAVEFLDRHPGQGQIAVNDMSLPFGGIFDIKQAQGPQFEWAPPHDSHSYGTAVDVRGNGASLAVPFALQEEFTTICDDEGAIDSRIEFMGQPNQHIHCRWPVLQLPGL